MNERPRNSENFESFAERQIREAQQSGQFDGLPGLGDPIPGIDEPLHDNWWIRDKLRRENIQALSPVLEARLETERLLEALSSIRTETELRRRVNALNEKIRKAHFSPIPGPSDGIRELDVEQIVERWQNDKSRPE